MQRYSYITSLTIFLAHSLRSVATIAASQVLPKAWTAVGPLPLALCCEDRAQVTKFFGSSPSHPPPPRGKGGPAREKVKKKTASYARWPLAASAINTTNVSSYISCCRERQARQAMYVQRNIEARSCNHCYRRKPISITYSECVSAALGIQHKNAHEAYWHLWTVWPYSVFPHYLIKCTI